VSILHISNKLSFHQKHQGILDGSDGSDGTSYPLTENYTIPMAQEMCRVAYIPPLLSSATCILVTGSLWEYLRVVRPESQGGRIPEFTGLMKWPSGAPGSTWEHVESLYSSLGKTSS